MSYIPTEKIHLSKNQVPATNINERMNSNSNLSANINPNYSSPFKKIPNVYRTQLSPNLQIVNSPLNPNNKTLFYYPPRQYSSYYGRSNMNLFQRNYYYNENVRNMGVGNNINEKNFRNKDLIKPNSSDNINMNINMNVSNNVYHFCLGDKNNTNNNLKTFSPNKYKEEKSKKKFICRCKKSNCMKLYCDCFANGEKCIGCNCTNCSNVIGNDINIKKVYDEVVGKNPVSMKLNLQKELKTNGCNCSKSNCLKKYCECFKAGLKCSKTCRCKTCDNIDKNDDKDSLDIDEDKYNDINENNKNKNNDSNIKENEKSKDMNNENENNIDNNIIREQKKYNYEKFFFEKISILIKDDKINIQTNNLLKNLDLKDELDNNIILFSNNTNDKNSQYLKKKTNRAKDAYNNI